MTTSDLDRLHAEILAHPDATEPRLAFAAACEAGGQLERAAFIRWQIEKVGHKRTASDGWTKDFHRMISLEEAHGREWAGPIASRVHRIGFFGGFVEWIRVDALQFLEQAEELYRLAPIRRLSLTNAAPVIEQLASSPHLRRIVFLSLERSKIGDRGVELLAASPHLGKLVWLDLGVTDVTIKGIEALAASTNLPALEKLELDGPANPVKEIVWNDQGLIIGGLGTPESKAIDERYGRKTWLHTVEDHGLRDLSEDEI